MRKAIVAGAAAVAVVVAAYLVAPPVTSQVRVEGPDRRFMVLDGRGSEIGVSIRDLDADEAAKAKLGQSSGAAIERVDENSPAGKAGLKDGDIIVEFDGERVRSARHLSRLVQETADGRTVKTTFVRNSARQTIDVTPESGRRFSGDFVLPNFDERQFERDLGRIDRDIERGVERGLRNLPRDFAFDFNWDWDGKPGALGFAWQRGRLGASLAPLTDQLAQYFGAKAGVLVSSVEQDSIAAKGGLKAGDVIISVNGRTVDSPSDVSQEVRETEAGKEIEIGVLRDRKALTLKVPAPSRPAGRRFTRPA